MSVEAVDPVFQAKMLDMLRQTGRPEMVVGWYHSHPGFGCWLSGVDINTQQVRSCIHQQFLNSSVSCSLGGRGCSRSFITNYVDLFSLISRVLRRYQKELWLLLLTLFRVLKERYIMS